MNANEHCLVAEQHIEQAESSLVATEEAHQVTMCMLLLLSKL